MMYKQYILIGLLISGGYIATLQSMEYVEVDPTAKIEIDDNAAAIYPPLALIPIFQERGFIRWEIDPENPEASRIDLPFLVHKIGKEIPMVTRLQSDFLKEFKKKTLPCIIEEKDLETLKKLDCMEFFELVETKKGTAIHPHRLLPLKKSDNNSQEIPQKRKRNDTEWQAQGMNENGELVVEAKLPMMLYHARKDQFKKPKHQKFLKKFKKAKLPYTITNAEEKKTFDSLKFGSFFAVKKIKAGWEVSARASIPTKVIDMEIEEE